MTLADGGDGGGDSRRHRGGATSAVAAKQLRNSNASSSSRSSSNGGGGNGGGSGGGGEHDSADNEQQHALLSRHQAWNVGCLSVGYTVYMCLLSGNLTVVSLAAVEIGVASQWATLPIALVNTGEVRRPLSPARSPTRSLATRRLACFLRLLLLLLLLLVAHTTHCALVLCLPALHLSL
jgi:hypothetical protein